MTVGFKLPNNIIGTCTLTPLFERDDLSIKNKLYISTKSDKANINQPIDLSWKINPELLNKNTKIQH